MTSIGEPLLFDTYLRPQIWGGDGLVRILGKSNPTGSRTGEAWELSTLSEHESQVAAGRFQGESLRKLWEHARSELSGQSPASVEFPWLVKWLDCADSLSVQVHPDDSFAKSHLGLTHGKSEAWVIVATEPGAFVSCGLRAGVTREFFESQLAMGSVEECLNTFEPRVGDCLSLPAGTVHTARGILVAEVQQPSDSTFRLFDWNRTDPAGNRRPLHHELGMEAIHWNAGPVNPIVPTETSIGGPDVRSEALLNTSWVRLDRFHLTRSWRAGLIGEMTVWMVLDGNVKLLTVSGNRSIQLARGSTVLVPADAGEVEWAPVQTGEYCSLLCIRQPTCH